MTKSEQWKDVGGYAGIYRVSNQGNIKRIRGRSKEHMMGQWSKPKSAYKYVRLTATEIQKREVLLVHRIVAKAFFGSRQRKAVCKPY